MTRRKLPPRLNDARQPLRLFHHVGSSALPAPFIQSIKCGVGCKSPIDSRRLTQPLRTVLRRLHTCIVLLSTCIACAFVSNAHIFAEQVSALTAPAHFGDSQTQHFLVKETPHSSNHDWERASLFSKHVILVGVTYTAEI